MSITDEMRRALENSVQAEQNAHDFYAAAAKKVNNGALSELFEKLAGDELGHRDFLKKLLADNAPPMTIKPQAVDYHLAEEIIADKPDLTVDMPFDEAIALAIKREEEAMATYETLARDAAGDNELRTLFINLKNMEQSHKTALESIYMNVAFAEVW
ncbi:MAG: ferritin family protein [Clostridiaceae bacterium]|nr:ferritin family protein [Clostridiaceae bacterium]